MAEYRAAQENTNLSAGDPQLDAPLEKDFSNAEHHEGYHLDNDMDSGAALNRIRTAGSISISPELFEKIYLSPHNKVSGDLRKTFGNPTPIALIGFLISLTPLSCTLMGWRGAAGNGAATTGVYFFFGGVLMIAGALGEWIIGNTFPCVVFASFGAFWLSFGATQVPFYNAWGAFAENPDTPSGLATGLEDPGFNASFGFLHLWMGFLCLIYMICALRTNLVFVGIFATLIPAFGCLAGAYWHLAQGNADTATTLLVAAGAVSFISDLLGWWIFAAIMLAALDFPFQLPVGDLSRVIKGHSEKQKEKERYSA